MVTEDLERRRRVRSQVAVDIKLHAPSQHFMLLSRTVDISSLGAFVRSSRALPVGENVTVHFDRGRVRNPLTFEASVVRVGESNNGSSLGFAVEFVDMTDLDESLVRELIAGAKA